jgi:hypothetical protein
MAFHGGPLKQRLYRSIDEQDIDPWQHLETTEQMAVGSLGECVFIENRK